MIASSSFYCHHLTKSTFFFKVSAHNIFEIIYRAFLLLDIFHFYVISLHILHKIYVLYYKYYKFYNHFFQHILHNLELDKIINYYYLKFYFSIYFFCINLKDYFFLSHFHNFLIKYQLFYFHHIQFYIQGNIVNISHFWLILLNLNISIHHKNNNCNYNIHFL